MVCDDDCNFLCQRTIYTDMVARKGMANCAQVASDVNAHLITMSMLKDSFTGSYFDEKTALSTEGEKAALSCFAESKKRHTLVRLPLLYSGDAHFFQHLAMYLQNQKIYLTAGGSNIVPLIHSDDAASAIVDIAKDMLESQYPVTPLNNNKIFHVIPPKHSPTQADLLATLAATIGAPKPVKPFFPKLNDDEFACLALNFPSSSQAFYRAFPEWTAKYASFEEGFAQMASFWSMFEQTRKLLKTKT